MSQNGWIGVDLDGTIAEYSGWISELHIGKPIPKMIERVQEWIKKGITVKIVTARVSPNQGRAVSTIEEIRLTITKWCVSHVGKALEIVCCKDFEMIELWDDRCKQVIPNTGIAIEDLVPK